ncbi:MAG TPA: hypothetical protein VHE35_18255 [Kofleriaceae bacterium]|nr:hypothetical protein [Kofleriaceae bacterium]
MGDADDHAAADSPGGADRTLTVDGGRLTWRPTPWDARALGVDTIEITELATDRDGAAPALLARLEAVAAARRVGLATVRVDAERRALKQALQDAGYAYVETSHPLVLAPLAGRDVERVFRRTVPLERATRADQDELAALARDAFDHSRFHEDARIHPARARARYHGWIADNFDHGDELWLHRRATGIGALMTLRVEGDRARLLLGGTRPADSLVAPMFWAAIVAMLRDRGLAAIDTRVSAANLAALRLHVALGFVATATELGFTRIFPGGEVVGTPPDRPG